MLDSPDGYHDWIEYNVEAEALGFRSAFCVEHHFTGYGQVSATLNLLTWLGARTKTLRLGTAVLQGLVTGAAVSLVFEKLFYVRLP